MTNFPRSALAFVRGAARRTTWAAGPVLCAVLMPQAGCSGGNTPGPGYDSAWRQAETVDIQAVVKETSVRLTNTTPRAFGRSRLWLNRWYSREIESLAVGQTVEFPLASFVDENGDEFRGGGFFATRKADKVVLAQLQTDDGIIGLVVIDQTDD